MEVTGLSRSLLIIAIDHCILHSHYFGVKKCLAQIFCVAIRKYVPISIGRIFRCYTRNFFPLQLAIIIIIRNDFAFLYAKMFLY